jgi:PAS domain S-box-containing protein
VRAARKSRILVVDDEILNRRLIHAILAPEGHDIVHASDGVKALELVANGGIDLVLLDVLMPGIDGIDVCQRIRSELGRPILPVIVISALTDPTSRTRAKAAGADDFLTKPIHQDELVVRVRNLLLLREYYALAEHQREKAETEARTWRVISSVARVLAGALDYHAVAEALLRELQTELGVELVAVLEANDTGAQVVARAPGPAGDVASTAAWHTWVDSPPSRVERRSSGAAFQPLLDAAGLDELVAIPISIGGELCGVFGLGRMNPFTGAELALIEELSPHLANAIATVRSHARTIRRLKREETERHEAEAALRASEERHRILFDASPLPIWVFDPKTLHILAVNDAMTQILGYSRDELLAMRVSELKPPEEVRPLVSAMATIFSGKTHHVGVMRYFCKDRRTVELDITSHATMLDGDIAVLALGVDVTHSRKVEEQLRQSQKMDAIGQLAGGVAHDFNNILAAILGCTDLAIMELGDDHRVTPDLKEIDAAAHRAAALTRQLLAFSRQQRREVSVLALNSVVTNVEKMLTRIVGEDIEMSAVLSPQLGAIEADTGQLEQVLMNLVVNARDAMPHGGRLTIETVNTEIDEACAGQLGVRAGRYVMLAVSDTGIGMDAATQARVFEPFFTTKEVGKGTGLGLSTVFGIVKQSGGGISIYSEVGQGSTFRVYLPRVERAADITLPIPRGGFSIDAGARRVLLVEDDDRLRAVIRRQLTSWGYSLVEARNAATALDLLHNTSEPIDLLLTDLVMPGIDGHALANQVLVLRPTTKVLFMSGYTQHPALKTAALGARDQFIEKPFTSHGLSSAIRRALEA